MSEYYRRDGITVRSSTIEDVEYLSTRLRKEDIEEVWASHRHKPEDALRISLETSTLCLTIDDNGTPVGMFGVHPETMLGNKGVVWFLSSDRLEKIKSRFLRHGKSFINLMLNHYGYLYNFVDTRNVKSVMWLKFLGAKFSDIVKINDVEFQYFSFEVKQ